MDSIIIPELGQCALGIEQIRGRINEFIFVIGVLNDRTTRGISCGIICDDQVEISGPNLVRSEPMEPISDSNLHTNGLINVIKGLI